MSRPAPLHVRRLFFPLGESCHMEGRVFGYKRPQTLSGELADMRRLHIFSPAYPLKCGHLYFKILLSGMPQCLVEAAGIPAYLGRREGWEERQL